jgi:hypothetical protein
VNCAASVSTLVIATILHFVDAEMPMAFGFALVGCACFMARQLTQDRVRQRFLAFVPCSVETRVSVAAVSFK